MEVERALAFLRALTLAGAAEHQDVPAGTLLRSPAEPQAYVANQLLVDDGGALDARTCIDLLDDLQRGLGHRRAYVQDDATGERLCSALRPYGWGGGAEVVMALPPGAVVERSDAVAADTDRLQAIVARTDTEAGLPVSVAAQLRTVRRRALELVGGQGFVAVSANGEDVAHATVYGTSDVAQIDDVATLVDHRGQGHAKSVVAACVADARARGAEIVFLTAEADDWPRHLYAGMGFVTVARTWVLQREGVVPEPGRAQSSASSRRPPA